MKVLLMAGNCIAFLNTHRLRVCGYFKATSTYFFMRETQPVCQ